MKSKWFYPTMASLLLFLTIVGTTYCGANSKTGKELSATEIKKGNQSLEMSCHDPQVIYADGTYYMTGSHIILAESSDLQSWDYISNGNAKRYISNLYSKDLEAFSYVGKNEEGGYSLWAGNIFYNEVMGKYCLYFCTSSTYIKSTLALATADVPEGPYTYTDTLLYSGFSTQTMAETNVSEVLGDGADTDRYFKFGGYNNDLWPNCIDPAVYVDADGRYWMVYGSWSGGIFELELDPATGLPIHPTESSADVDPYFGYHLIGGGHHACEGAYITYNETNGYYYLFVSYGNLQREGGYQIRQFRSTSPTGPYVDAKGNRLEDEENYFDYGLKMVGNYEVPSLKTAYMAPGGQSVFADEAGKPYMVYHQRFDSGTEYHEPRVHGMYLNSDDWYVLSPFAYRASETETTVKAKACAGTFYVLNHETDVSNVIHRSKALEFTERGEIRGEDAGTYVVNQTNDGSEMELTLHDVTYRGPLIRTVDEAGNVTLCFMAVGDNNETLWGVKYLKENKGETYGKAAY